MSRLMTVAVLALLAGGFFYLDSFRSRIVESRSAQAGREARLMAQAVNAVPPAARDALHTKAWSPARVRLASMPEWGCA